MGISPEIREKISPEIREKSFAGSPSRNDSGIRKPGKKKVVSVPMANAGDVGGGGGAGTPPSDSWAWRKYGQKPIKGSPYPRGYYRCSSFKGCPARKQVERSRSDPTTLVITYSSDHNHDPSQIPKNHKSQTHKSAAKAVAIQSPSLPVEQESAMADSGDHRSLGYPPLVPEMLLNRTDWFGDAANSSGSDDPDAALYGSMAADNVGSALFFDLGSELKSGNYSAAAEEEFAFYADLEELPEGSAVFRRSGFLQCTGVE